MKAKENALNDFIEMTKKSWTFGRLTEKEKNAFLSMDFQIFLFGSYKQRFYILHGVYSAFLDGCGYSGPNWRESHDEQ